VQNDTEVFEHKKADFAAFWRFPLQLISPVAEVKLTFKAIPDDFLPFGIGDRGKFHHNQIPARFQRFDPHNFTLKIHMLRAAVPV
jgi:hypothetical protein